jgi:outer membrane lipoprotein-sorting protein
MRRAHYLGTITIVSLLLWPSLIIGQGKKAVSYKVSDAVAAPSSTAPLAAGDIVLKMSDRLVRRDTQLSSYTVNRTYEVVSDDKKPPYVVRSEMTFSASPKSKNFKLLSKSGTGGTIPNMVYDHAVTAEKESLTVTAAKQSGITTENYDFVLQGQEQSAGVDCYVLELKPKRNDKMLLKGKIWVTTSNFDIVRVEGFTAKSPSIWIKKIYLIRQFQEINGLWLPKQEDWIVDVRLYGQLKVKINHQDYKINKVS